MTRAELERILDRDRESRSELDSLEERELEVVSMLSKGMPAGMICNEMGIEAAELDRLKRGIRKRFGLKGEVELLQFSVRHCRSR